jgi:hypothetical protein
MSRKPMGWRMPKPLSDEVWSRRRNQSTMLQMHDFEKHPVAAESPLDDGYIPSRKKLVAWKRPRRKDGTRPEGSQFREVIRERAGVRDASSNEPRGGRFVSRAEYERRFECRKIALQEEIDRKRRSRK